MTSALDMPEIMSYIYSKSWKLQFSASSSIIIIEDYYLQTFLHSLPLVMNTFDEAVCLEPDAHPLFHSDYAEEKTMPKFFTFA